MDLECRGVINDPDVTHPGDDGNVGVGEAIVDGNGELGDSREELASGDLTLMS